MKKNNVLAETSSYMELNLLDVRCQASVFFYSCLDSPTNELTELGSGADSAR